MKTYRKLIFKIRQRISSAKIKQKYMYMKCAVCNRLPENNSYDEGLSTELRAINAKIIISLKPADLLISALRSTEEVFEMKQKSALSFCHTIQEDLDLQPTILIFHLLAT